MLKYVLVLGFTIGLFLAACYDASAAPADNSPLSQYQNQRPPITNDALPDKDNRQKMREMLMSLPPEERMERIQTLREQHLREIEQQRQQRRAKFERKWQNSTLEEREKVCDRVRMHCEDDPQSHSCQVAEGFCVVN